MSVAMQSLPRSLGNVMSSVFENLGITKKIKRHEIVDQWAEIVGSRIAQATRIDRIEGDKLFVVVSTSAWRNELTFLKKELLNKVNGFLGEEVISDIIFR